MKLSMKARMDLAASHAPWTCDIEEADLLGVPVRP